MDKIYISANQLLIDSFKLAEKIVASGFRANFVIAVWRGGTPVGIAIQEYLEFVGLATDHIAIRTSSYTGIKQREKTVSVHGLDYVVEHVHAGDQVLLVDDIFDSGRSIQAVFDQLGSRIGHSILQNFKIACPWYKPSRNMTDLKPDYYLYETDNWLVFPHELKGLSRQEIIAGKGNIAEIVLRQFADQ